MAGRIVVIEDDQAILDLIVFHTEKAGFETKAFTSGHDGLAYLLNNRADLLVLDLMLPDIDGLQVCREIRADVRTKYLPIIMVTAKGDEVDRVVGLELGADDYLVKPFSPKELLARIKGLLRRTQGPRAAQAEPLAFEELTLDPDRRTVQAEQKVVALTATEFKVLETLMAHPGRVFTRQNLLDLLGKVTVDRNIDVHVTNLRQKLGRAGRHIKTVRGFGYKLDR